LSTAFSVSASAASDTETPSRTSAVASRRFAGVIRLRVPIWSSLPQRPQFESSVFQRSYWAAVTVSGAAGALCEKTPCPVYAAATTAAAAHCRFMRAVIASSARPATNADRATVSGQTG